MQDQTIVPVTPFIQQFTYLYDGTPCSTPTACNFANPNEACYQMMDQCSGMLFPNSPIGRCIPSALPHVPAFESNNAYAGGFPHTLMAQKLKSSLQEILSYPVQTPTDDINVDNETVSRLISNDYPLTSDPSSEMSEEMSSDLVYEPESEDTVRSDTEEETGDVLLDDLEDMSPDEIIEAYMQKSGTKYSCKACQKFYMHQKHCRRHIKSRHLGPKVVYACPGCKATFSRKDSLVRHSRKKQCGLADSATRRAAPKSTYKRRSRK